MQLTHDNATVCCARIVPLFLFCILLLTACDEPEQLPVYLHIEEVEVQTDSELQGSNSSKVSTVWVFANEQPIGAYDLPAYIPVLSPSTMKISIQAGIPRSGIFSTRVVYPFYTLTSKVFEVEPLDTVSYRPVVTYKEDIKFKLVTDFESGNPFRETDNSDYLDIIADPTKVFEGSRSARVQLKGNNKTFDISSLSHFELPVENVASYLEFDYQFDYYVELFIEGRITSNNTAIQNRIVVINPKTEWNKFYADLSDSVQALQRDYGVDDFKIVFRSTIPDSVAVANFYWDNVKLLHQ